MSKDNADQTIDQLTNHVELFTEKGTDQDAEMYDMLSNNPKRWNSLNEAEQLHANWYITQYGGIR